MQKEDDILLSVIMPCYNVEKTFIQAIDSILMQEVNFTYEIILVNDASTDNSLQTFKKYKEKYKHIAEIIIIEHEKNLGNALSFYDALSASKGKYFCVLDGDDFYTVRNKFQKQIDFLESDKNEEYVATAHHSLNMTDCYQLIHSYGFIFACLQKNDFTMLDFLAHYLYFHTSTYMYRNIFKGSVPDYFKEDRFRGDNPRTFFHLHESKAKVKILNFIGSVYRVSGDGIWSKLSHKKQVERNHNLLTGFKEYLTNEEEKDIISKSIKNLVLSERNKVITNQNETRETQAVTSSAAFLSIFERLAQYYSFGNDKKDLIFSLCCYSQLLDSACESIGFVEKYKREISFSNPVKTNTDTILINIPFLHPKEGGVFNEIKEIVKMYSDKKVYILLDKISCFDALDKQAYALLASFTHCEIIYGKPQDDDRISHLFQCIIGKSPEKIYHYVGHDHVYAATLIQSSLSKNICVFSFDHGLSLGISNSSYDTYITKRPLDYQMLKKDFQKKVLYIPVWNEQKNESNKYIPYNNHEKVITACAAVRFYKLAQKENSYIDLVLASLKITEGIHIHFGEIPIHYKDEIKSKMEKLGLKEEQFINIDWAQNLSQSLYDYNVDIFIEPFPTISLKITLEVLSAGIPILSKVSTSRMQCLDIIYDKSLQWKTKEDFLSILNSTSKEILEEHSKKSYDLFMLTHHIEKIKENFRSQTSFGEPLNRPCLDCKLVEISKILPSLK